MRRPLNTSRSPRVLGLTLVAALAVAGCGDSGEDGVELRLGFWGADNRVQATEEIVEAFEAEHPEISIELEYADWGGYWERLPTQTAGNDAPDIMQFSNPYLREYAERGSLLPLPEVDRSALDDSVVDSGVVDDEVYGIPVGINIMAFAANVDLFEEAGVEIPDDETWTWEDLQEVAVEVSEATGAHGMGAPVQEAALEIWLRQQGKGITDENDQVGFEPEDAAEYFEMLGEFEEAGAMPSADVVSEQHSGTDDQLLLWNNEAALGMEWNSGFGRLQEVTGGSEFEIMRFPSHTGQAEDNGLYSNVSMFFSGSAQTDHPEEVQQFIDFMVNSEEVGLIDMAERGFPANLAVREAVTPELDAQTQVAAEYLDEIEDELGEPRPITPLGFEPVLDEIYDHELAVLFGDMTPEEAGESLVAAVEAEIS